MSQKIVSGVILFLTLVLSPVVYAGKMELTTYYPAPHGEYKNLNSTEDSNLATVSGNVGIGTATPSVKFHVDSGGVSGAPVSAIRIVDGNQGAGKMLVSDADGVGTWQAASGAGPASWVCGPVAAYAAPSTVTTVSCPANRKMVSCMAQPRNNEPNGYSLIVGGDNGTGGVTGRWQYGGDVSVWCCGDT